jgi:hypothetical protein
MANGLIMVMRAGWEKEEGGSFLGGGEKGRVRDKGRKELFFLS